MKELSANPYLPSHLYIQKAFGNWLNDQDLDKPKIQVIPKDGYKDRHLLKKKPKESNSLKDWTDKWTKKEKANPYLPRASHIQRAFLDWLMNDYKSSAELPYPDYKPSDKIQILGCNSDSISERIQTKFKAISASHAELEELTQRWMTEAKPDIYLPKNGFIQQAHLDWFRNYNWDLAITLTLKGWTQDWSVSQQENEVDTLIRDYWNRMDQYAYGTAVKRHNKRIQRCGFRQKLGSNLHLHGGLVIPKHIKTNPAERRKFKRALNWAWDGLSVHTGIVHIDDVYDSYNWNDYDSRELRRYDTAPDTWCRWTTTVTPTSKN